MPLHLLGKKSWNVYNSDNIARVKADEAAAAAREAADEQRMQELDAERRAAILRGRTPPPLPDKQLGRTSESRRPGTAHDRGHVRKRRKLAGEDDTDLDIRMAKSIAARPEDEDKDARVLKLRSSASDAPLQDHAGNIDLFPVDMKEALKRERNAEAEREKRKKEKALEDQYTMRFSNAAGRSGIQRPWYAAVQSPKQSTADKKDVAIYEGFVNKDVWGNEDPRRKDREQARITTNDPFAFMQKAQAQLKKSKQDKKQWAEERSRELMELRSAHEREHRRSRHLKRKRRDAEDSEHGTPNKDKSSSRHKHRHRTVTGTNIGLHIAATSGEPTAKAESAVEMATVIVIRGPKNLKLLSYDDEDIGYR
ncbi:hypothetical protein G6011_08184 [Alternaria panax]|uniref:CBF1-interacting co-repressor CIR N-terminal domain-containing protein n=1 Tax=Alternaria panax TaxID=48097 RepID=A0AAD4FKB7_9PLEO|nr:hypothetical protein G6011_08184 [Alternaria panax]